MRQHLNFSSIINATLLSFTFILIILQPASAYRSESFKVSATGTPGSVQFSGWCNIWIGNKTLMKINLEGKSHTMEPVLTQGRFIDKCELRNDSGQGSITLILHKNNKEIFKRTTRDEETTIIYNSNRKRLR